MGVDYSFNKSILSCQLLFQHLSLFVYHLGMAKQAHLRLQLQGSHSHFIPTSKRKQSLLTLQT